jgi:hypothetical protein
VTLAIAIAHHVHPRAGVVRRKKVITANISTPVADVYVSHPHTVVLIDWGRANTQQFCATDSADTTSSSRCQSLPPLSLLEPSDNPQAYLERYTVFLVTFNKAG